MKDIQNKTKIIKVSMVLRNILFAGLVVQGIGMVALIFVALTAAATGLKSQIVFENCGTLACLPLDLLVTLNFFRLFARLQNGHLFDSKTVKHLESAGKWWIGLGIVQVFWGFVEAYLFSPNNIQVSGDGIVAGLAVFFIAWFFREAQALQEEQELTV